MVKRGLPWAKFSDDGKTLIKCTDKNMSEALIPPVEAIGERAFSGCALSRLVLPEGLKKIGANAFKNMKSLIIAVIPSTVEEVGSYAFEGCDNLKAIYCMRSRREISGYNSHWNGRGAGVHTTYFSCTPLQIRDAENGANPLGEEVGGGFFVSRGYLTAYTGDESDIRVPDCVTHITNSAFYNRKNLTSITIPDSVTAIEEHSFEGCESLTSLYIGKGVVKFSFDVLQDAPKIERITVDPQNTRIAVKDGVLVMDGDIFSGAFEKSEILEIPYGVREIEKFSCMGASYKRVIIPDSVEKIGEGAFKNCKNLERIDFGNGLSVIGNGAFENCVSLRLALVPHSVRELGDGAFMGCSSVIFADIMSVPSVPRALFRNCVSLKNVAFCKNLTTVGARAFENCQKLRVVYLANGCRVVQEKAFKGCEAMYSLVLPENLHDLAYDALQGCTGLTAIRIDPARPPVPEVINSKSDRYFVKYGALFESSTFGIALIKYPSRSFIRDFECREAVNRVMCGAFEGCVNLERITINCDNTVFVPYALSYCENLTELIFDGEVKEISENAFWNCSKLKVFGRK